MPWFVNPVFLWCLCCNGLNLSLTIYLSTSLLLMLPTSWMGPYLICLFVAVIFHMQAGGAAEILVLSEMWNAAAAPTLPWNFERVSDKSVLQGVRRRRCQNFGFTFHWNKLSDYFFNPLEFLSTMSTFCTATLYLFVMCACLWLPFILLDFDILSSERRVKLAKILQILAAATG